MNHSARLGSRLSISGISGGSVLLLLTLTHTTNDAFTSMLAAALPTLQRNLNLNNSELSVLVAVLSFSGSMLQPFFGGIADRLGRRNTAAIGVLSSSVLLSLMGVVPNFWLLVGLLLLGGLGSAAFHPAATAMARQTLPQRSGLAVALFGFGGTVGLGVGPVLIVAVIAHFGIGYSPLLMVPGFVMALLVWWLVPSQRSQRLSHNRLIDMRLFAGPIGLLALAGVLRGIAFVTFVNATPLWLVAQGFANDSRIIATTLALYAVAAGLGGIAGGYLNRFVSRRILIPSVMLLALPVLCLIVWRYSAAQPAGDFLYYLLVMLAGLLINGCVPLLIITAQDLAPHAMGTASGMLMGFTWGSAGVLYTVIGRLQEMLGLTPSMYLAYTTLLPAAALAAWVLHRMRID